MQILELTFLGCLLVACSDEPILKATPSAKANEDAGVASVDQVEIVRGVPNRGRDPAVVALRIGGDALCTGTLIAKDVVLTARHCVSRAATALTCPADAVQVYGALRAESVEVILGDRVQGQEAAARGLEILAPEGVTLCDADIAAVVLDRPIRNVKPLGVRLFGVSVSERIRAVGFGRSGDGGAAGLRLVREHVEVREVRPAEFSVGEATCQGDSGGPALDEDTGEVLGVISRGGPTCVGKNVHNIYTRTDAFMWLVDAALARSGLSAVSSAPDVGGRSDAGVASDSGVPKGAPRGGKDRPPSDVGAGCTSAIDCAAGVCLHVAEKSGYCSRSCGAADRCPNRYHCRKVGGESVCVQAR